MKVSVIVPAYNAAATLAETLASIASQSMTAAQIIVVDDGSSDATADIARGVPGVTVVRRENGGMGAAMNTGVSNAIGDAIAFIDSDDLMTPDRLRQQSAILEWDPDLAGVVGDFEEFVCPNLDLAAAQRFRPRSRETGWLCGATLLRSGALRAVGPFEPSLRVGTWIDWMARARAMDLKFQTGGGLALRRRLRPGTLNSYHGRDADLLMVARRALARKRGGLR